MTHELESTKSVQAQPLQGIPTDLVSNKSRNQAVRQVPKYCLRWRKHKASYEYLQMADIWIGGHHLLEVIILRFPQETTSGLHSHGNSWHFGLVLWGNVEEWKVRKYSQGQLCPRKLGVGNFLFTAKGKFHDIKSLGEKPAIILSWYLLGREE